MLNLFDKFSVLADQPIKNLFRLLLILVCFYLPCQNLLSADEAGNTIDIVGFNYGRLKLAIDVEKTPQADKVQQDDILQKLKKNLLWSGLFDLLDSFDSIDLKLKLKILPGQTVQAQIYTPEDTLLFESKKDIKNKDKLDERMIEMVEELILQLTGEKSILRSAIVYVERDPQNEYRLVLTDSFGGNRKVILENQGYIILPRWNPQANAVLYTALGREGSKLCSLSLLDKKVTVLFEDLGRLSGGTWNKAGNQLIITLTRNGNSDLYKIDMKGNILQRLTTYSSLEASPRWSPDEKRLLFVSDRSGSLQIYQTILETGETFRMTFEGTYNVEPNWSNDSSYIVYAGRKDGISQIFLTDKDGEFVQQITYSENASEQPYWAPNGRQILFTYKTDTDVKLFIIRADGTFRRRLTDSGAGINEFNPTWSDTFDWSLVK